MNNSFREWMSKVDKEVDSIVGLSAEDLADIDYYELWEDGVTASVAALKALRYNGYEQDGEEYED